MRRWRGSLVYMKSSVTLKVHGHLRWYIQQRKRLLVDLRCPKTAGEIVERAGIPGSEVGALRLNGRKIDTDKLVCPGDVLDVIPVLAGG